MNMTTTPQSFKEALNHPEVGLALGRFHAFWLDFYKSYDAPETAAIYATENEWNTARRCRDAATAAFMLNDGLDWILEKKKKRQELAEAA